MVAEAIFTREPNLYFDPNEICVVFEPDDPDKLADSYERIGDVLNEWLARQAGDFFQNHPLSDFARLIAPPQNGLDELLRSRPAVRRPEGKAIPFCLLPPPEFGVRADRPPAALAIYQVKAARLMFALDQQSPEFWQEAAKEAAATLALVNLLYLAHKQRPIDGRIIAVTPNWLGSAAHISPSPGSKPVAIPEDAQTQRGWTFTFDNLVLDAAVQNGKSNPKGEVEVAILDTRPATADILGARGKNNMLDDLIATTPSLQADDEPPSFSQQHFDRLAGLSPNREKQAYEKQQFDDHGLFIAGIIHDIAPRANLRLVRVLGGFGVSALQEVAEGLRRVYDLFVKKAHGEQGRGKRLVINLSLGLTLPPGGDLIDEWLIDAVRQKEALGGDPGELQAMAVALATVMAEIANRPRSEKNFEEQLEGLIRDTPGGVIAGLDLVELRDYLQSVRQSAREIFAWIEDHPDVLVVAAAGNDRRPSQIPEPRYPASDEQVMGVAAVNQRTPPQPTIYTNRGDTGSLDDGVAIWGGDARPALDGYSLADITVLDPDTTDAIKGVYCAADVLGTVNRSGWVYWSGTSFATPIVAGLAAALWAGAPDATAQDIKSEIRFQATQPTSSLAVDAIIARQIPVP